MLNVSKFICVLFILLTNLGLSQSTSEKLKKEQQLLEKNISNTKQLLQKVKSNTESSFNELKLLNNQIDYREKLVRNFDNQIRSADLKIKAKKNQIDELSEEIKQLKEQYKKLLIYAYKHRNKYGKMMYLFSSDNYFEAIKRAKYLEKIQETIKKQFLVIDQHQKLIAQELKEIEKERAYKAHMLEEKKIEREQILADQQKQQAMYENLKSQEGKLLAKLQEEERKRAKIKSEIDAAIRKEVAAAEAKRKKAEEEARRKAEANKPKPAAGTKPSVTTPAAPTSKPIELPETKENLALSKSFEGNRGKLPWPVEKGNITEGFGRNAHPTIPGVYTNNNGVDISSPKNAQVRSVFDGEVTSVMNIPGAGKVVIIKHGNYRTVYSNLQSTFVNVGDKVSTKQVIGSLVSTETQNLSISHFEIHQVVGSTVTSLNPSLWLAK